jgi:DNA-binding GntR family transcriptional regulator
MIVTPFDATDVRQLFETRRALEEVSVRLAAQCGDRGLFEAIAESFAAARPIDAPSIDAYYALIARLEELTDSAADNAYLTAALRTIRTHLTRARKLARANQTRLAASVAEHTLIARAIADGDAELAAHATHIHLHNALTSILDSIRKGPQ